MTRPSVWKSGAWAGGLTLAALLLGCQTPRREVAVQPQPATSQPAEHMAQSDTQRAVVAIDDQTRDAMSAREPYDPEHRRPVDQPRVYHPR